MTWKAKEKNCMTCHENGARKITKTDNGEEGKETQDIEGKTKLR